ncbi:uncharacterized protein LOC142325809 [Lycorma delicatula]|uniref:uncharacterized protein LOC142325809 n=1 Tax=Lycorma delicatula TaxID=130591 RepID=UPI003F516203
MALRLLESSACVKLAGCVIITDLKVPPAVVNGSHNVVDLDCLYRLAPNDSGLVLKWFLNGGPQPVYQWIGGFRPQLLSPLQGRANLSARGSTSSIRIYKPTIDLSGDYECHVSTFHTEDYMLKRMVVFVPEDVFRLVQIKDDASGSVSFHCQATGVFPRPKLTLYRKLHSARVPLKMVTSKFKKRGLLYDMTSVAILKDEELYTTALIDCELKIPGTNYVKRKTSVYYSDKALIWTNDCSDGLRKQTISITIIISLKVMLGYSVADPKH